MAKGKTHFTPEVLKFLAELKLHNNRDWFLANKERYETQVRDPFLRFLADLGPGLAKINPNILVDPSPSRGSMMRIYRDIRFSDDKTPYRTFLGARFLNHAAKDDAMPAFYLHIGLSGSYIGAGIWHPGTRSLRQIRDAIVADPNRWRKIASKLQKDSRCTWAGETLTRPPRGYAADHPLMADLKRKDFAVRSSFAESDVYRPNFLNLVLDRYRAAAPLVGFLSGAVGLK